MEFTAENLTKLSGIIGDAETLYQESFDRMKFAKDRMVQVIDNGESDTRIASAAKRYRAAQIVHTEAGKLSMLCRVAIGVETLSRLPEIYEAYKAFDSALNSYLPLHRLHESEA
jgi:hypothetical protein